MDRQFVTYEIALAMKELGFNEPCLAWYLPEIAEKGNVCSPILASYSRNWNTTHMDRINCILWQQAIDWFREKYGVYIVFLPLSIDYGFTIMKNDGSATSEYGFKSHYDAREAAILKVIELIKKNIINDTTK